MALNSTKGIELRWGGERRSKVQDFFFFLHGCSLTGSLESDFPGGLDGKESACNAGHLGSIPWLGRSLGEGNGYPLRYSCLENSTDRGAWQATVHRVAKSWTGLSD